MIFITLLVSVQYFYILNVQRCIIYIMIYLYRHINPVCRQSRVSLLAVYVGGNYWSQTDITC